MEYTTVTANSFSTLEDRVNSLIQRGWIPQGGMAMESGFYAQAMIKQTI